MCDNCQSLKNPTFLIHDVIITGAYYYCNVRRNEILEYSTQTPSVLFQDKSENSQDSRVEMLSESQNVEEMPIPNENMCEQPSEWIQQQLHNLLGKGGTMKYWSRKLPLCQ